VRSLWRGTQRPIWHDVRPVALGLAVVAVFVLGTRGYQQLELGEGEHYGFWDAFVRSVRLFGFEGSFEGHLPTELKVAALLGPALVTYAAVIAFLRLSRERAQLLSVRLFARDHVVVAGLGEIGSHLVKTFHDARVQVVGIEIDEAAALASGARQHGVPVILGDAADPTILERAQVRRARHLLVTCGDDMRDVNVALAARRCAADRRGGVLSVLAHIADVELWRRLTAETVANPQPHARLEFFNVPGVAARVAVERHSPFAAASPRIAVVGLGDLGESVLLHAASRWRELRPTPDARLVVVAAAPDAAATLERLCERNPGLAELCALQPHEGEVDDLLDAGRPDVVYLCLPPSQTLAAGLALHRRASAGVPIVALVPHSDAARVFRQSEGGFADLEVFGILDSVVTPALLVHGTTELLARARHAAYVRCEEARGESAATNPSIRPWDELDESLRESNRRAADGISDWLEAAGLTVLPAPRFAAAGPEFAFDGEQVERLARLEHERWAADLRADGWRPTAGAKDPARKLHPLLDVPWEGLDDVNRDRDREPVRLLPQMLLAVGLELRPQDGPLVPPPVDLPSDAVLGSAREPA
jgi:voltage-gated potassium channel Kch